MFTCTFLKISLSHMLSCLTTPFLSSASFLLNAKSSSHFFSGVLAWLNTCSDFREIVFYEPLALITQNHRFKEKQKSVTIRRKFLKMQQANTESTSSSLNFEMLYLNSVLYNSLTLSNMRLSIRGTTGNTVGRSSFKSSIRSRMSPWKNPIRAPWTRMTPWWKESCLVRFVQFKVWHFVHMGAYSSHQIKGLLFCYLPLRHIHTGLLLILKINRLLGHLWITNSLRRLRRKWS